MRPRSLLLASSILVASALSPSCSLEVEGIRVEVVAELGRAAGPIQVDDALVHLRDVTLTPCSAPMSFLATARADHGGPAVGGDVAAGAPTLLGVLRPPAGEYCAARVTIDPAAEGLSLTASGRDGDTPFAVRSFGSAVIDLPLVPPLALDEERRAAVLAIELDLAAALASIERDGHPDDVGLDAIVALSAHASAHAALSSTP